MATEREVRFPEDDDAVDRANSHDMEGDATELLEGERDTWVVADSRVREEAHEDGALSFARDTARKDHAAVGRGKQVRGDGFLGVDGRGSERHD